MLGWLPDGRSILFSSDRSGAWDAWMQPVENGVVKGEPRLLKRDFGHPDTWPMGVTKDGSFYYGLRHVNLDILTVSLDPSTGRPQARPQKASLRFEGSNGYPCWSPDGSRLAYTSSRRQDISKPTALCVKSTASGEEREYFPQVKDFRTLSWFPDGHSILCRGMVEPLRPGLFRYDLDKGESEKLLVSDDAKGGLHGPMLSGDGKRIFYDLDDFGNKIFRVMTYELETSQKKELIRGPNQIVEYDLSRDGRRLAFKENQDGIACLNVMSSEGREKATLLKLGEGQNINSVVWSPDGRHIYFSKWEKGSSTGGVCSLWRIAAAGGQAERFDVTAVGMSILRFHPDGGRLAFMSWHVETEVWVMENFLPVDKKGK
jgi:Tol biopolymer transport system component